MDNSNFKIQIIVMAYNRPEHTAKVLEALEHEGAENIKLFIDGPKNSSDSANQQEILNTAQKCSLDINIVERETNIGLAKSITNAVTSVLEENHAVVVLEDDCVPKKGFLTYMNTMLRTQKNNKNIGSVCGYTYPHIPSKADDSDIFVINRFCPWGWGTWKDRWEGFSLDLKKAVEQVNYQQLNMQELGNDIYSYCTNDKFLNNKMDIWSLSWILQQFIKNMNVVYPRKSLIRNIGFDGTGVHSSVTNIFDIEDLPHDAAPDFSRYNSEEFSFTVKDHEKQKAIVSFLEQNSKMTYTLRK